LPPKPPYSWVLSEPCCSVAGVGGVSSSVWRPSLSGFIPPSVTANGASSLPVSSTPQAGQWGSTGTSDGPAIVGRDPALPRAPSGASISSTHLFRKSWRVAALGHLEAFRSRQLNAGSVIRKPTFAGTHGNGRDAPIPVLRGAGGNPRPPHLLGDAVPEFRSRWLGGRIKAPSCRRSLALAGNSAQRGHPAGRGARLQGEVKFGKKR